MFLIINKQKICTYLVTVSTVITLLFIAVLTSSAKGAIETSKTAEDTTSKNTVTSKNYCQIKKWIFCWILDKIIVFKKLYSSGGNMFFIGIITDKNSENNIKNIMKCKLDKNEIIFLNKENLENYRNVVFDSIVINNKIDDKHILDKIIKKSNHVLCNSDIKIDNELSIEVCNKLITYGYNSGAVVTISSVTDDNYLIYVQKNIEGYKKTVGMQEIKFEKNKMNINVYDGMIATIIDIIYNK